ncbi:Chemotaxis protein CheY [Sporomusa rhizae]|uniref:response regulator n=1 Tax=Sporomusa rhizae TaxID=357999 RepID=UPI00352B2F3E
MRVLVVDDSKFSRELIISYFHKIGIQEIDEAADGLEAISKIKMLPPEACYDVITLDVVMPRKTGIQALKDIKNLAPESKIIVCSSLHDLHTVNLTMGFGVDGYVVKPFTREKLLSALWNTLKFEG